MKWWGIFFFAAKSSLLVVKSKYLACLYIICVVGSGELLFMWCMYTDYMQQPSQLFFHVSYCSKLL